MEVTCLSDPCEFCSVPLDDVFFDPRCARCRYNETLWQRDPRDPCSICPLRSSRSSETCADCSSFVEDLFPFERNQISFFDLKGGNSL